MVRHFLVPFFLLFIPLSGFATEMVLLPSLLAGECNPCEIKLPEQESFTISYEIEGPCNWEYLVDLRLDDAEFDDLSIGSEALSERDHFSFYAIRFFDDHRLQIYGLFSGEGVDGKYYYYFVRGEDRFYFLGHFVELNYVEEWDVFSSDIEGDFYRLDGNKLVSVTQNAQIEPLSDRNCNPCEIKPAGQEPFTFSYTIDETHDGEGYPLVIELNNVKFGNLNMYQLGYLATNAFYQIKFFDDHRFQIYGFPTGAGGGTSIILQEFHLFVRDEDTFHYLGHHFNPFLYHKEQESFEFDHHDYRLIENKLLKIAQ